MGEVGQQTWARGLSRPPSRLQDRVVFAFGVPRSGTYWLQRILTAHPEVAAVPNETHLFSKAVAPFLSEFHHGASASPSITTIYADRETMIRHLRELCDDVLGVHLTDGAKLLCERSPWHVRHVGLMAELYPDARFVHIVRDPRDVARSMVSHEWGPDTLAEAAGQWRESILMARKAAAPHYLELRYEEVLSDFPAATRQVYEWLGLDASDEIIAASGLEAEVHVNVDPARTQVGLGKWRAHLSPEQVRSIEQIAGDLMAELGYEASGGKGATGGVEDGAARGSRIRRGLGLLRQRGQQASDRDGGHPHDPVTAVAAFDVLLTAIHGGDTEALASTLAEDATVQTISERGEESLGRGEQGAELLEQTVREDPAFRSEQVGSTVHSTFPTTVGVLSYRLANGSRARRLIVASAAGEKIAHVTVQRL